MKVGKYFISSTLLLPAAVLAVLAAGALFDKSALAKAEENPLFEEVRTLTGHKASVYSVAFSPDGAMLASGSWDKTVKLWDAATGRELRTLRGHKNSVFSVAFSPDGAMLASGSSDNTVKLWDTATGRELRTLRGHENSVLSVAFSPDGAILASGSRDKTIKLWDFATGRELRTLRGHEDDVTSVAFSPDGAMLASGSSDNTVKLWDAATRRELSTLKGHESLVLSVSFSPDGSILASGSYDNTVKLWDAAAGRELRTLRGHNNDVWYVTFSPDGSILASGSDDKTIKLWDVASGRELRTLRGHISSVLSVTFNPDGAMLASGSVDNSIKLWGEKLERGLPPNLFAELDFRDDNGDGALEALESAELSMLISNRGKGPAQRLQIAIQDDKSDPALKINAGKLKRLDPGETREIVLHLESAIDLQTARHRLQIDVQEYFHYDMDPAYLLLSTRAFLPPELVFSGLEIVDAGPDVGPIIEDGQLQPGELVKARIVVQNTGAKTAESAGFTVESEDVEIYLEGGSGELGTLKPGEVKEFWVTISPTKRVQADGNLPLYLTLSESSGRGGLDRFRLPVKLNQKPPKVNVLEVIPDLARIQQQEIARFEFTSQKFSTRTSSVVDIRNVAPSKTKRKNSVAVVIGVENYETLPPAPYASNDAEVMELYFKRRFGVEEVVLFSNDQVSGFVFDDIFDPETGDLQRAVLKGETELFVFYSGHGVPNKDGSEIYLFPSDGKVQRLEKQGYSLNKLYENLNKLGAKSVMVILDACFSGAGRASGTVEATNLIASKPAGIKVTMPYLNYPNFTVINSSSGIETSLAYNEASTGLFTYYLAAGLKGEADGNCDRKITMGELKDYVIENVVETSKKISGLQTPQFHGDLNRVLVEW